MNLKDKYSRLGENDKIVYKNVLGAFVVKGIALFVTLYTLPAYIVFFNDSEALGLWFTVLSLLNWILNFDLGIGNGLRNHLSASIATGNKTESRQYISSAYFSIGLIVLIFSVSFPFFAKFINFNKLLNISVSIVSENALYLSVVIVFVGVMLQFWLKLINSILYALQKSSLNNFLVLCTNLLILFYVKFAPSASNDANIVAMSIVHALAVMIPLLWATIAVFRKQLKDVVPSFRFVSGRHIRNVLSLGGVFFAIQIAYMLIMSTNEYLISSTTCNSDVIDYQAYYKLYSLGGTIFALALTPIWSVITKAQAENNIKWIRSTYYRFVVLAVIFSLGEFVLVLIAEPIMNIWLGEEAIGDVDTKTSVIFAIFGSVMIAVSLLSSIANGLGRLKAQSICYTIGAVLKIPLSILFVKWIGTWQGVVIANIICMAIYCFVEPFVLNKYFKLE